MRTKVLVYVKDGMIQSVHANGGVEVIVLDEEQDSASSIERQMVQEHTIEKFDQLVQDSWKRTLENEFKFNDEVKVSPDGDVVTHGFSGRVMDGVQTDTDGSFYVNVKDMDENCFSVDIMNVSIA